MSGDNHFSLMSEGLGIIKALDESSPSFFSDMSRLREIIMQLGEGNKEHPANAQDIDFGNPKEVFDFISSAVKNAASLPEAQRNVEILYCNTLLTHTSAQDMSIEDKFRLSQEILEASKGNPDSNELFKFYSDNAPEFDIGFAVEYPAKFHAEVLSYKEKPESTPEWEKEYAAIMDEKSKIRAFRDSLLNESKKEPNNAINEKVQDATDKLFELEEKQREMVRYKYDGWNKRCDELIKNQLEPIGKKIISTMLEKSPVTKEQADKWARGIEITPKALKAIEKNGYKHEDLLSDIAEMYRLTGGKIPPISFNVDKKKRAYATGIKTLSGKKEVYVGNSFKKRTLFHEMAHHLENDSMVLEAANGFLQKRRKSDKVVKLKKLCPNQNYDNDEYAWEDNFISPYVGKKYDNRVTEVLSMGVEVFSDPIATALLYSQDNEMMKLITGYMASSLTPAMSAILKFQETNIHEVNKKEAKTKELYELAIQKLSSEIVITDDKWPEKLESENHEYLLNSLLYVKYSKAKYYGSVGKYFHIFEGKFRSAKTRREAKGYMVIHVGDDTAEPFKREGAIVTKGNQNVRVHFDTDHLKAFIKVAMLDDEPLSRLYHEFFIYDGGDEKLIKLAGVK